MTALIFKNFAKQNITALSVFLPHDLKFSNVIIATFQYRMWNCKLTLQVPAKIEG